MLIHPATVYDPMTRKDLWVTEVRDPAAQNAEPLREICRGHRTATYQLAQIPAGWAWTASAQTGPANYSGSPWTGPVTSRDDALAAAIEFMVRHYRTHEGDDGKSSPEPMLALLEAERPSQEAMF